MSIKQTTGIGSDLFNAYKSFKSFSSLRVSQDENVSNNVSNVEISSNARDIAKQELKNSQISESSTFRRRLEKDEIEFQRRQSFKEDSFKREQQRKLTWLNQSRHKISEYI